jgi:hypothetical protein
LEVPILKELSTRDKKGGLKSKAPERAERREGEGAAERRVMGWLASQT